MAALYEYVIGIIWGEEEEEVVAPPEEEADSLDDSLSATQCDAAMGSTSRMVIRKPSGPGSTQSFKAIPSMVIKEPEPKDHYDARVISIILAPAGVILGLLGCIMTVLAYTSLAGFPYEESAAFARYDYNVKLLGPLLVGIAVCCELMGFTVVLCTPHHGRNPMIYPQKDEDDAPNMRSHSSRRVSIAPAGQNVAQSSSGASLAHADSKIITPGSALTIMKSAHTVV